MKVKLPILFNTYSTQSMQNSDIDYDLNLCDVRPMIFYRIDSICEYIENEIKYCQIFSGGTSYYCTLPVDEVEYIIDKQKQLEFIN